MCKIVYNTSSELDTADHLLIWQLQASEMPRHPHAPLLCADRPFAAEHCRPMIMSSIRALAFSGQNG